MPSVSLFALCMLYSHIHLWTQTIRDGRDGNDVLFVKSYLKSFNRIGEYDIGMISLPH